MQTGELLLLYLPYKNIHGSDGRFSLNDNKLVHELGATVIVPLAAFVSL